MFETDADLRYIFYPAFPNHPTGNWRFVLFLIVFQEFNCYIALQFCTDFQDQPEELEH